MHVSNFIILLAHVSIKPFYITQLRIEFIYADTMCYFRSTLVYIAQFLYQIVKFLILIGHQNDYLNIIEIRREFLSILCCFLPAAGNYDAAFLL